MRLYCWRRHVVCGLPFLPPPQAESPKRQAFPLIRRALRPNVGKMPSLPRWGRWTNSAPRRFLISIRICLLYSLTVLTDISRRNAKDDKSLSLSLETTIWTDLEGAKDTSSVEKIESGIALQEALARMDDSFRAMAWCYSHDFSWDQIGTLFGVTKEQARKRFEYGIRKLRKMLRKPPTEGAEPE